MADQDTKKPPVAPRTADCTPYDETREYFFYNPARREVMSTAPYRRVDADHLGTLGLRVVAISELYRSRSAAATAGQERIKAEIRRLENTIADLEIAKSPDARSLKNFVANRRR